MTHDERFERAWNVGEVLTKKGAKEAFLKEFAELQAENDRRLESMTEKVMRVEEFTENQKHKIDKL
jgi:hypothetical protein